MSDLLINCPTCNQFFLVAPKAIKCGIFRCAIKKSTYKQTGAHAKKSTIDKLKLKNNLIGCGNPFKYNKKTKKTEICGWI